MVSNVISLCMNLLFAIVSYCSYTSQLFHTATDTNKSLERSDAQKQKHVLVCAGMVVQEVGVGMDREGGCDGGARGREAHDWFPHPRR